MDAAAEAAINLISQLPEPVQEAAANAYQVGVDLVITAVEYLAAKVEELYQYVVDFMQKSLPRTRGSLHRRFRLGQSCAERNRRLSLALDSVTPAGRKMASLIRIVSTP